MKNSLLQRWLQLYGGLARPVRILLLFLLDAALIGIGLCVFSLFHHVMPREEASLGIVSGRNAAPQPTQMALAQPETTAAPASVAEPALLSAEAVPQPTIAPAATPDPVGYFGTKFADKFTDGEVIARDLPDGSTIYHSANLNVTRTTYDTGSLVYYVIDFYIKDIACLKTAFANDTYGRGQREWPATIAAENNAIAAINGDYFSARSEGVVLRNGELYRNGAYGDLCVLYWDGTMETFVDSEYDIDAMLAKNPYQVWNFGPMLLQDGQPMKKFNSSVTGLNPRTAIGYFEPGHYCFVAVDGRSSSSKGLTMAGLSQLMYDLGCTVAYNLDGGQTSQMMWGGEVINQPYKGGRRCSDIVLIAEP